MSAIATLDPYEGLSSGEESWLRGKAEIIGGILRRSADEMVKLGRELLEVRNRIEPGKWEAWIKTTAGLTKTTAFRFIQMAQTFDETFQVGTFTPAALNILIQPETPKAALDLAKRLSEEGHQITGEAARGILIQVKPEPSSNPTRVSSRDAIPHELLYLPDGGVRTARLVIDLHPDLEGDAIVTATLYASGVLSESGRKIGDVLQLLAKHAAETAPAAKPAIDPEPHIVWARAIGAGVASEYQFAAGSQERADLEAAAAAELVAACHRFDVSKIPPGGDAGGLLRGYAHQALQKECRREAHRLRNGGTYRTRRDPKALVVGQYEEGGDE